MKACLLSCKGSGFRAEPFEGVTPDTLDDYKDLHRPDVPGSRIEDFKRENEKKYLIKKSCFTNHVRLWHKCIELNQPIAVIEQDAHCVWKWDNRQFEDVLILNVDSAFRQPVFQHIRFKPEYDLGIHRYDDYSVTPLIYYKPSVFKGSFMMPGTAAYAITPQGAKKLLKALDKYGWEQSDFFINSHNVTIQYAMPEYFTFKLKNLNMSHGF
jgi:GR25 family glycosyltransferase involved in LPS biosynthesis